MHITVFTFRFHLPSSLLLNSILSLLASSAAYAGDPNRQITIYPTQQAVDYVAHVGDDNCKMSLDKATTAHVLEETDTQIKVIFDQPMHGCSLYIPFISRDSQVGWIPKKDISYSGDDNDDEDAKTKVLPPIGKSDRLTQKNQAAADTPAESAPCDHDGKKDQSGYGARNLTDLLIQVRAQDSGMKTVAEADQYVHCYPLSERGEKNFKDYQPFMDNITDSFNIEYRNQALRVQPTLFRCLLRRESGFDPNNTSNTGAKGVGQHTNVNIENIHRRISNPNTWESKLWKKFFDSVRGNSKAQAMLSQCQAASLGKKAKPKALPKYPTFHSKADASCPLQSLAASAIYNLEIQQALLQNSKVRSIEWNKDLEYQLAIGASYNLGDGAAGKAVNDLVADGWVKAIQNKPSDDDKKQEVKNHVAALRNCMESGNKKPMFAGDKPVCDAYKGNK